MKHFVKRNFARMSLSIALSSGRPGLMLCSNAEESGGIRCGGSFDIGVVNNMSPATKVVCNFYCDSVSLKQLSATLANL